MKGAARAAALSGIATLLVIVTATATTTTAGPAPGDAAGKDGAPGDTSRTGARLFETWEAAAEGGVLMPLGDLSDVLDPALLAGLRLTTSYYRDWQAVASLSGALLDGPDSPVAVAWAAGSGGLEWREGRAWIPALGLALALYYIHAVGADNREEEYLFLEDGESEFGIQGTCRWLLPLARKAGLQIGIRWDMMFTRPDYTHAAAAVAGIAWTP